MLCTVIGVVSPSIRVSVQHQWMGGQIFVYVFVYVQYKYDMCVCVVNVYLYVYVLLSLSVLVALVSESSCLTNSMHK